MKILDTKCNHEFIVFSTGLADHCLMVECRKCKAYGTVDDPSKDEWRAGWYAPSNPYRWFDNSRVVLRPDVKVKKL